MSTNLVKAVNLFVCKLYSVIKNVGLVCFLATNSHSFATATAFYTLFHVTLQFAERSRRIKAKYHYASWFGASSVLASVMEFGFNDALCYAFFVDARLVT